MEPIITDTADVLREIKAILVRDLQLKIVPEEIPADYSLLERGLALDSIVIAELIAQIEDRFGLQFDDRVLDAALFDNLSVLAVFVARECEAARAGAAALHPDHLRC